MNDRVHIEINDGIADVKLMRPDKSNALDGAMFDGLIEAGQALQQARGVRAVVLSGQGKGFCSGIDKGILDEMLQGSIAGTRDLREQQNGICNRFQYAAWIWRDLPMPVIAAVHGFALGGGLELALGADMRYVTPDARMAVMEVAWGLVPDMGGTVRMFDLMSDDLARELAFTGRIFSGSQALGYGLATRVESDPYAAAMSTAREIAARSPDAVRSLKRIFNQLASSHVVSGLNAERVEQQMLLAMPNQLETIFASKEGRSAKFTD